MDVSREKMKIDKKEMEDNRKKKYHEREKEGRKGKVVNVVVW